ncbi:MAG: hypothetical protein QJR03_16000 [Sphaerobacter sp.]|nr:hypothetical protein [Sphaerobacter sp.]
MMARARETRPRSGPVPVTEDEGEIHFGCSMLRRTRLVLKGRSRPMMRCSLGYSVRTEEDKRRCLAVEGPSECWHLTPPTRPA